MKHTVSVSDAKEMFLTQKAVAKYRGIQFKMSFIEWLAIWDSSGHLHQRGRKKGQYVMARYGDQGPYSFNNVEIITTTQNLIRVKKRTGIKGKRTKLTEQIVRQIRNEYVPQSKTNGIQALAQKYGIHRNTVGYVLLKQRWKDV